MNDDAGMKMDPESWIAEHGDALFGYAYTRLRNRAVAEDVVQETFLGALKSRDRFTPGLSVRAWLMGILKHKVVDHIRKSARQVEMSDEDAKKLIDSPLVRYSGIASLSPPQWQFSPRKVLDQKEFWGVFQSCLSKLQELQHAAFVMKEVDGLSTEEICKELDISANYLWVTIHRAREQLKACLNANWTKDARD